MLLKIFLKRRCNFAISAFLEADRINSRVAINRRVLTRRLWIDFADALARERFQAVENSVQDLSKDDNNAAAGFIRRRAL
jgi:hypothetical protein